MVASQVYVTNVTPFKANDELDIESLKRLIGYLEENGIANIVPLGTTGEFSSLTLEEKKRVISVCAEEARRARIIAGVSSTALGETLELCRHCLDLGVREVLLLPPYYLRGDPAHFKKYLEEILGSVDVHIWVYNNPRNTGIDLGVGVLADCLALEGVVGVKDATEDLVAHGKLILEAPQGKLVVGGLEDYALYSLIMGSAGFTTSLGNFLPRFALELNQSVVGRDFERAIRLNTLLLKYRSLMLGSKQTVIPQFAKLGLKMLGIIESERVRPPLRELDQERRHRLEKLILSMKEEFFEP